MNCVIFDLDGTLLPSEWYKQRSSFDTLVKYLGHETASTEFKSGNVDEIINSQLDKVSALNFKNELDKALLESTLNCTLPEQVSKLLNKLRDRNVKAFIVSATPEKRLSEIKRNLFSKFNIQFFSSHENGKLKEFKKIKEQNYSNIISIGDGVEEFEAAHSLGFNCLDLLGFLGRDPLARKLWTIEQSEVNYLSIFRRNIQKIKMKLNDEKF